MRHYLDVERDNIVRDFIEDPRFKQAYKKFVAGFLSYRSGEKDYPMAEREELREVYRIVSGKEYPE